jgi:hypothetical protein
MPRGELLTGVGVGTLAVVCCVGLPVLVAAARGLALGAMLAGGAAVLVAVSVCVVGVVWWRRLRACTSEARQPRSAA